jgi:hypothetical protein
LSGWLASRVFVLAIAVVEPLPNNFEVCLLAGFWELRKADLNIIVDPSLQVCDCKRQ